MKAKKGINTLNNQPIVVVFGNTYPARTQLKQLGFRWYGKDKVWFMPEIRFNNTILQSLNQLSVDTSGLAQQTPQQGSPEPLREPQVDKPTQTPYTTQTPLKNDLTDKKTGEYINSTYPINKNIYSADITININGKGYPLIMTFGRIREHNYDYGKKTMPVITYTITQPDNPDEVLVGNAFRPKDASGNIGRWNRTNGPNYNEDEIVRSYVGATSNEKSRLYNKIKMAIYSKENLEARDPELTDLLKKWDDWKYDKEHKEELKQLIEEKLPKRFIKIDGPIEYEGEYPVSFNMVSGTIYIETGLEHSLAPRPEMLARVPVEVEIKDLNQLNGFIDQALEEEKDKIKEKYLKYLKSFAFTKEEEDATRSQMEEIAQMILNKDSDIEKIRRELMKRQFIRPRKKKNIAPGMVPEGEFKLIIDDKAIRGATFSRDNSPEYFWVAIAYNLMRLKHNNINFDPVFLDAAYERVAFTVSRYGHKISALEVARYIYQSSRALYFDLTEKTYKSREERRTEFYSGFSGNQQTQVPSHIPAPGAIDDWVSFVARFNVNAETAKNKAQEVFRLLAKQLHPDVYKGPEGDQLFIELKRLYDDLPDNLKQAHNWYKKVKISSL